MKQIKENICNYIEILTEDIINNNGCMRYWGEVELPQCLREEIENEKE